MIAAVRPADLVAYRGRHGLNVAVSALPVVPMVQAHLAVPLVPVDGADLATFDVLAACWSTLPAFARFERYGGAVTVARRHQWLMLSLSCLADGLPALTDALACVVAPGYTDATVRSAAALAGRQARLAAAVPGVASARALWAQLYGRLPVVLDPAADPARVDDVSTDAVRAAHARYLDPGRAHLVVVGDLDPERVIGTVDGALDAWRSPRDPAPEPGLPYARVRPPRIATRYRAGMALAHLRLAGGSCSRHDPDAFAAMQVAAQILGGGVASRINAELRERRGLAYRTTAYLADHLDQDVLAVEADVNPAAAGDATRYLLRLLDEYATTGPTPTELAAAVGQTIGRYALNLGSQGGRAACLMSFLTSGFPVSEIAEIPARAAALTLADVQAAAARYQPRRLAGVVHGANTALPAEWTPDEWTKD